MSNDNVNPPADELLRDLYSQLNKISNIAGKGGIVISDKKVIDVIFGEVKKCNAPQFIEAFKLLPYIEGVGQDYSKSIFGILKQIIHLSEFSASLSEKVISAISSDFYAWSDYFTLANIKEIVKKDDLSEEIFKSKGIDHFFNSIEIYENAATGIKVDRSLLHDTALYSTEENLIFNEGKHLLKIKRTMVISLLRALTNRFDNADESKKKFDDLDSFVCDLNYLTEFSKKTDPEQVAVNEFVKSDRINYLITDKETAKQVLDLADLRIKEGNFDRVVFSLLPYIKVEGESLYDLHSFRIQRILQSALSPGSKIIQQISEIMIFDIERWLSNLTTEHIKYLIDVPMLAHAEQESLNIVRLDFKQLLKVMNIIDNVAERKFNHPVYLEFLLFSVLNNIVENGRKIYIKRIAVVASLSIHANLFRNHPDLYGGYHPYFYNKLLSNLKGMQQVWNGDSHLCLKMLQLIGENDKLFGVYPKKLGFQKQTARNVEKIVEKIRKNWMESARLAVD